MHFNHLIKFTVFIELLKVSLTWKKFVIWRVDGDGIIFLRFRCQVSHISNLSQYQDQNQSSSPRFAAQGYCARLSLSHHFSLTLVSVVLSMTMVQLSHSETSLSDRLMLCCYLTFDIIMCFTIY